MHAFDTSGMQEIEDGEDGEVELDIKKSFFCIINPEGRVIDCAKIYSFLHEENIFKRIFARINKDIDERVNKK